MGSLLPEGSLKFHAISKYRNTNLDNILISLLIVHSMFMNKMLATIFIYIFCLWSVLLHLDNFETNRIWLEFLFALSFVEVSQS